MLLILRRLCWLGVVLALGSELDEHLGDSITSEQSEDELFSVIDINGNGRISEAELFEFVQETGGDSLDESKEVHNAVTAVMSAMDGNHDKVLKKDDLSMYMKSLASLLPLDEVARWVAHAQQMPPDVVKSFVDNGITGYDFPELLQRDGLLLEQELGIHRLSLKRRLLRGMRMKLLGMGNHPAPPELLGLTTCPAPASSMRNSMGRGENSNPQDKSAQLQFSTSGGGVGGQTCQMPSVLIQWGSGDSSLPSFLVNNDIDFPIHKYQLYRERTPDEEDATQHQQHQRPETGTLGGKDILIYEGMDMFYKDRLPVVQSLANEVTFTYRLVAWNVIGRSEYTVFEHNVPQLPDKCLQTVSQVSLPPSAQIHVRSTMEHEVDWVDNKSSDLDLKTPRVIFPTDADVSNIITPVTGENISITFSLSHYVLGALFDIYYLLGVIYYLLKVCFVSMSFLISLVFTVLRVKSLLALRKAVDRQNRDMKDDSSDDAGGTWVMLLRYFSKLEPFFYWLQHSLLAPLLCTISPIVSHRLEELAESFPTCKPLSKFIVGALQYLLKLVLEVEHKEVASSNGNIGPARRPSGSGKNSDSHENAKVTRGVTRSTSGLSTESSSSGGELGQSYNQCSICLVKVTNKIFSTYMKNKQKRHHCSRCGNVFCRNCGHVDHSDFMQCQVPGKCVCRNCGGAGEASIVRGDRRDESLKSHNIKTHRRSTSADQKDLSSLFVLDRQSGSKNSSRSSSPCEGLGSDHYDSIKNNKTQHNHIHSAVEEAPLGKPPLPSRGLGSGEKNTRKYNKMKLPSLFGGRHKSPSPPPLRHSSSENLHSSVRNDGISSCDLPDMRRSTTTPCQSPHTHEIGE